MNGWGHVHLGRSWSGSPLENDCPCGKAPCGLVDSDAIDPTCPQHALTAVKTMRQIHRAEQCEALTATTSNAAQGVAPKDASVDS